MIKRLLLLLVLASSFSFASKNTEIVFSNSYLAQPASGSVNTINLFTPDKTGIYRITIYIEATSNSILSFAGDITYTSAQGSSMNSFSFSNGNISTVISTLRAVSGNSISVDLQELSTTFTYDAYIVVERIDQ